MIDRIALSLAMGIWCCVSLIAVGLPCLSPIPLVFPMINWWLMHRKIKNRDSSAND